MSSSVDTTKLPGAYAQWVTMFLTNSGTKDIMVKNLILDWGKLYANNDKDDELPTSTFEGHVIQPTEELQMNACGREDAASGTSGHFDIIDCSDGKVVRHFYWDCPWGRPSNTWSVTEANQNWLVESKGGNYDSGALGSIYTEFVNTA